MKITLSKAQWEFIGNRTGWIKTTQALQEIERPSTIHPKLPPLENDTRLPKWVRKIIVELKTFINISKVSYNTISNNVFIEFLPQLHSMEEKEVKKIYEICDKYNGAVSTINDRSVLLFR